jgi:hypothetical protein
MSPLSFYVSLPSRTVCRGDRGWDVGEPPKGEGFEWSRDLRNGIGMDKPDGAHDE